MEKEKLNDILTKHNEWLNGEEGGVRADLRGADLRGANLRGADLRDADLIVITLPFYTAYIHAETARVGCKHFTHEQWISFSDDEICMMDGNAIEFWSAYKHLIFSSINAVKTQVAERVQKIEMLLVD